MITLAPLFANDMVVQRLTTASIWGWADSGEEVAVIASWGASASAITAANGRWVARLDTPEAGGPHTLEIKGSSSITLSNVLSGDVWLCSGQSNMEWPLELTANAEAEISQADFPTLRVFDVEHAAAPKVSDGYQGAWSICTSQTAGKIPAVAYYFGKEIHASQNIPIGLLSFNWGGTRIEPWISPVGLRSVPGLKPLVDELDKMDPGSGAEPEKELSEFRQNPTWIFNGMIAPVLPVTIMGAIWYQGESNGGNGREAYRDKMQALIDGWRAVWQQAYFPFYFVQLANFQESDPTLPAGGDGWSQVRQAQLDTLSLKNTGMAVAIDLGEADNLHPSNKQDVGKRLARWALVNEYGKDIVPSGPIFRQMIVDGGKAILIFDYVGSGLMIGRKLGLDPAVEEQDGDLKWFSIVEEDGQRHWADAVIHENQVIVSSPKVSSPVAVRYAFAMNPAGCNLYNKEGLPASPFTTEESSVCRGENFSE